MYYLYVCEYNLGQSVLKPCWLPPVLIACYEKPSRPILFRFNKSVVSNVPSVLTGNAVTLRRQQFRMPHLKTKIVFFKSQFFNN